MTEKFDLVATKKYCRNFSLFTVSWPRHRFCGLSETVRSPLGVINFEPLELELELQPRKCHRIRGKSNSRAIPPFSRVLPVLPAIPFWGRHNYASYIRYLIVTPLSEARRARNNKARPFPAPNLFAAKRLARLNYLAIESSKKKRSQANS